MDDTSIEACIIAFQDLRDTTRPAKRRHGHRKRKWCKRDPETVVALDAMYDRIMNEVNPAIIPACADAKTVEMIWKQGCK